MSNKQDNNDTSNEQDNNSTSNEQDNNGTSNEQDNNGTSNRKYKNCLLQQLSELEMLEAIFWKPGELKIDRNVITELNNYVTGITSAVPSIADFIVNLTIADGKLEIYISLPHSYPVIQPNISITFSKFSSHQHVNIMKDVNRYIQSLTGDICIYSIVNWVCDNVETYCSQDNKPVETTKPSVAINNTFSRYWIYSHHIYNKEKRKEIVELAQTYKITGFCLPGKPGVICIEGLTEDCDEWWQKIKSMTWKKITCKQKEEIEIPHNSNYNNLRKFNLFSELDFSGPKTHMDMGKFYCYLLEHDCNHIFKDYFGMEGKCSSDNVINNSTQMEN